MIAGHNTVGGYCSYAYVADQCIAAQPVCKSCKCLRIYLKAVVVLSFEQLDPDSDQFQGSGASALHTDMLKYCRSS